MTDEYLLEHGYKQYPVAPYESNSIAAHFQKRFDDSYGKKYFINVSKYSHDYVPVDRRGEWWKPFSYEYEVYFTMSKEEKGMTITFHSGWALEDVEEFVENFFNTVKPNYYETWDEC